MKQNLIKIAFDADRLGRLDSALQTAEQELADLMSLAFMGYRYMVDDHDGWLQPPFS